MKDKQMEIKFSDGTLGRNDTKRNAAKREGKKHGIYSPTLHAETKCGGGMVEKANRSTGKHEERCIMRETEQSTVCCQEWRKCVFVHVHRGTVRIHRVEKGRMPPTVSMEGTLNPTKNVAPDLPVDEANRNPTEGILIADASIAFIQYHKQARMF